MAPNEQVLGYPCKLIESPRSVWDFGREAKDGEFSTHVVADSSRADCPRGADRPARRSYLMGRRPNSPSATQASVALPDRQAKYVSQVRAASERLVVLALASDLG